MARRLLLVLGILVLALPANAATVTKVIGCKPSHQASDDPILAHGQPGAFDHLHIFFGAKGTDAFSTPDSLVGTPTTCLQAGDTAAYWVPKANLVEFHLGEYWDNRFTPQAVKPVPFGAELVIGNGRTAGDGKASVFWTCSNGVKALSPLPCTTDRLTLVVRFPNCWDGALEPAAQIDNAHFAYSSGGPTAIQIGTGSTCPASHPVKIAEVAQHIRYRHPANFTGITLSSGGPATAHADFLNAWVPSAQCSFLKSFTATVC